MRYWLFILSLLQGLPVFCQENVHDFSLIDQQIKKIRSTNPEVLSQRLTAGYATDMEKVRAIFRWIAEHIEYKSRETSRHPSGGSRIKEEAPDTSALKPVNERVAETVLKNGTAVCDGYARLFKTLCDYAGISNEIITGYARGSKGNRRFGSNHMWNAVYIGNKWELMDVTWASGYFTVSGSEFIREFDESYFMSPPGRFITEHYPDNLQWTLMDDPPLMEEFRNSPYKQKTFGKYRIKSYSPQRGLLEVEEGDTLYFKLESLDAARDHQIYSDLFPDTSVFRTPNSVLLSPSVVFNNTTQYSYCVASRGIQWLYLLYNDDVVLRYRLQIKKEKETTGSSK